MRLGSNHLRLMALSISLRDTFPMGRVGMMDYEHFWRASLYQAMLAEKLAKGLSSCRSEEAFVAGLVLEIGFLIFYDLFLKGHDKKIPPDFSFYPLQKLLTWEQEHFGVTHRQIGEEALRYWRFPESITQCQRVFTLHEGVDAIAPIVLVTEIAREFSALICDDAQQWAPIFDKAEAVYGISSDVLSEMLVTTLEGVDAIADSLKVAIDAQKDATVLIKKANISLNELSARMLIWQRQLADKSFPLNAAGSSLGSRDMLQAIMHEIRNPLTLVGGFAKRLANIIDKDTEGWQYVQIILEESRRLENFLLMLSETHTN
jgi:hypothetical protein